MELLDQACICHLELLINLLEAVSFGRMVGWSRTSRYSSYIDLGRRYTTVRSPQEQRLPYARSAARQNQMSSVSNSRGPLLRAPHS